MTENDKENSALQKTEQTEEQDNLRTLRHLSRIVLAGLAAVISAEMISLRKKEK